MFSEFPKAQRGGRLGEKDEKVWSRKGADVPGDQWGMTFWFWIGQWSHAIGVVTDRDRPEGGETEGRETTWKAGKK